jgi:hypothetical protein
MVEKMKGMACGWWCIVGKKGNAILMRFFLFYPYLSDPLFI